MEPFCRLGELLEPTNPLGFRILRGDHFMRRSCGNCHQYRESVENEICQTMTRIQE